MFKKAINKVTKDQKGFTLAELLIVVAIIGVLVAISIPIFTSQLEKSREATDLANVRSAYAEIMSGALTEATQEDMSALSTSNTTFTVAGNPGEAGYTITGVVKMTGAQAKFQTNDASTAVAGITATGDPSVGGTATITYSLDTGAVTIVYA